MEQAKKSSEGVNGAECPECRKKLLDCALKVSIETTGKIKFASACLMEAVKLRKKISQSDLNEVLGELDVAISAGEEAAERLQKVAAAIGDKIGKE